MLKIPTFLLCLFLALCAAAPVFAANEPDLANHPIYAKYQFGREGKVVDMGSPPLSAPMGVIGGVMQHDQILHKALAERGWELRIHDFLKGADGPFFFQRGDLDLAIIGDFPAIALAASYDILVTALAKQGFVSILGKNMSQMAQLRGKRIGVSKGTVAHYNLLIALEFFGLTESDVTPVFLEFSEMPEALAQGRVDAIVALEPYTSYTLKLHPEYKVTQRLLYQGYLCFSKKFVTDNPEIAELMVAAYIRALRWMRQSNANLMQAVGWDLAAGERLLGKPTGLSPQDMARITTEELLKIVQSPMVPRQDLAENGVIRRIYAFLQKQGKIPAGVSWEKVAAMAAAPQA